MMQRQGISFLLAVFSTGVWHANGVWLVVSLAELDHGMGEAHPWKSHEHQSQLCSSQAVAARFSRDWGHPVADQAEKRGPVSFQFQHFIKGKVRNHLHPCAVNLSGWNSSLGRRRQRTLRRSWMVPQLREGMHWGITSRDLSNMPWWRYTMDNRRLYCLQKAAVALYPKEVRRVQGRQHPVALRPYGHGGQLRLITFQIVLQSYQIFGHDKHDKPNQKIVSGPAAGVS